VLRISEQWHASDLGRQRQGNEDNYFVRAPLFVVADGMGGAQAGEVASEMAVESFDEGLPEGVPAETLVNIIEDANRRIHDRSRSDVGSAGMGTTVTAAYVGEGEVTVAHVGDSRAYLLRGGDLIRLTRDHSLVDELVRRGKLTEEQAESHPQRSVITRALGPEPEVEVDVQVYQAHAGDLFMLCSDGLTAMVPEARVKPIIEGASSLEEAGRELIAAANEAGGRDNITVILFRLEEVASAAAGAAADRATAEYETWEGDALEGPRQGVGRPEGHTRARDEQLLTSEDVAHAVRAADEQEADYRRTGTMALSAVRPSEHDERAPLEPIPEPPAERPRRKRRRWVAPLVAVTIIVAIVAAGLWTASRAVYFIGVDEGTNVVAIYRGLPYELPFGIELYERYYPSGVTLQSVPTARRGTFTDHKLRSKDDAEDLINELERGAIE
jgi:serine/threonine protein phosphatase PrpC